MPSNKISIDTNPRVIIIAGPSCAGKTTFAREFLPLDAACPRFINADFIAQGLSHFAPEKAAISAGNVMQLEFERLIAERESFAFETTLEKKGYARAIKQWRGAGYHVELIFLQLDSPELAIARAAQCALISGPAISDATIRRDWAAGLENFEKFYARRVDSWALYDNSGVQPMLLDWKELDWNEKKANQSSIETARDKDLRLSFNALRRATKHIHDMAMLTGTPVIVSRNGVLEQISSGLEHAIVTIHEPGSRYENK